MTDNIVAIDFNGVKIKLETDDSTVLIELKATGNTGTAVTFHDARDNSNYQVPTGKKAHIIFIDLMQGSEANDEIFFADNADGTTNAVTLIDSKATLTDVIFITAEIPADKFINKVADTSGRAADLWIIEESA